MSTFLNSGLHVAVAIIVVGLILPVVAPPLTKAEPPECQPPESEELSSLVEAIVGSGVVSCDLQKSIYRITFKKPHYVLFFPTQLLVKETTSHGFPTLMKPFAGPNHKMFWMDKAIQQLRAHDRALACRAMRHLYPVGNSTTSINPTTQGYSITTVALLTTALLLVALYATMITLKPSLIVKITRHLRKKRNQSQPANLIDIEVQEENLPEGDLTTTSVSASATAETLLESEVSGTPASAAAATATTKVSYCPRRRYNKSRLKRQIKSQVYRELRNRLLTLSEDLMLPSAPLNEEN